MNLWRSSDLLGRLIATFLLANAAGNLVIMLTVDHDSWFLKLLTPVMVGLAYWHLRIGRTRRRYREIRQLHDMWERSDDT